MGGFKIFDETFKGILEEFEVNIFSAYQILDHFSFLHPPSRIPTLRGPSRCPKGHFQQYPSLFFAL